MKKKRISEPVELYFYMPLQTQHDPIFITILMPWRKFEIRRNYSSKYLADFILNGISGIRNGRPNRQSVPVTIEKTSVRLDEIFDEEKRKILAWIRPSSRQRR